jgi:hypothetical protein
MQTRYNTTLAATLAVSLVMFSACAENGSSNQPAGTGGSSGGSTSSTGGASSGGATAKGGTTAGTGGNSSGGNTSAGGAGSGGATSSGGKTGAGAGGSASGGSTSSGGGAAGGTTGGGGSSAAGGSVAAGKLCKFSSGLNVAWVQFAGDVPNPNIATFQTIFTNTYASGGRIVRWWFHTNGTVTPGYQADGTAQKIPQSHIDGVKAILAAANAAKIGVVISLWSFDMMQGSTESISTAVTANNHLLLENDTNRQAYIDNYLTPLVTALKGTPGLYAYEIFNEAEGMMQSGANGAQPWGWSAERTTKVAVQKCVNWFSAAIHAADPTVPVTTAAQTFDYCSNGVSGKTNYYSDSVLQSVGGKATGTLDFYEVHYYASNGASDSCFANPASYWKLDKRLIMGEFAVGSGSGQTVVGTSPVDNTSPVAVNDAYTYLYTSAYDGAWAWSYTEGNPAYQWPSMQTPMKNLLAAHADVGTCP